MIIDTAQNAAAQIVHLQADGVTTVMRYLTSNLRLGEAGAVAPVRALGKLLTALKGSSKLVTAGEVKALGDAGIRVGLVFENGGGSPGYNDITAAHGTSDATFSLGYLPNIGAPAGTCLFFACDNDFSASAINILVLPYFEAIAKVFAGSNYLVGVYGSGLVCRTVCGEGLAASAWLSGSMGWTESRSYLASKPKELVLVQDKMDVTVAGLDVDTDINIGEFGDFLPSSGAQKYD